MSRNVVLKGVATAVAAVTLFVALSRKEPGAAPTAPAVAALPALLPESATAPPVETASATEPPASAATASATAPAATPAPGATGLDDKGCVSDPAVRGARLLLDGALPWVLDAIKAGLPRPPTLEDVMSPRCFSTSARNDLDGDGRDETEVTYGCAGIHVWAHVLFFSNQGCPKLAATLGAGELDALDTRTSGVADLDSTMANGCAGGDFSWEKYVWNGKTYVVADRARCDLCYMLSPGAPRPSPGANRHPVCQKQLAEYRAR